MSEGKPQGSLISYFSRCAREGGGINLAQGKPGFSPPGELIDLVKELSNRPELHQYAPGNGNPHLLELLTRIYRPVQPINMDYLLITQGATEGLFQVIFYLKQSLGESFAVLSFDPVYESYPKLAEYLQLPFHFFPLQEDLSVNFKKLEIYCRDQNVKVIFVASPGNPLGKVWRSSELEKLLDLTGRLGIYVIFDGVYRDLYFEEEPCNPLIYQSSNLFYVASFSKMLSITGWRIGYVIADPCHMREMRAIHDYVGLCAPALFQEAIYRYLAGFDLGSDYLADLRKKIVDHYSFLREELNQAGFFVPAAGGGYFLWTRLPLPIKDGYHFARQLMDKTGVGVVPGENFSPHAVNYIRLNFTVDKSLLARAATLIREFVGSG